MAKKADLIAEAQKLGLELSGKENVKDLEKLLAGAKKDGGEEQPGAEDPQVNPERPEDIPEPEAIPEAKKGEVVCSYLDHAGKRVSRTFSSEVHGKNYKDLAKEFVENNGNRKAKIES